MLLASLGAAAVPGCGRDDIREWRPTDHEPPRPEEMGSLSAGNDADAPDPGAVLFSRLCAGCHGFSGRGDGPQAAMSRPPDLTANGFLAERSDDALRQTIVRGKGRMPGLGPSVEPSDLEMLLRHVRRFERRR